MDFTLSKEQELLRKVVAEFTRQEVAPLAAEIDESERFPAETVRKMAKYNLLGIPVPTEFGGAGGDYLSYVLTVEELSKACATTGVICSAHTSLACGPLLEFGTPEQKKKFLVPLARGEKLGAFALTEPNAGTDAAAQQTTATLQNDGFVLTGSKIFITNGATADTFVVFAMTDRSQGLKGISAFVIEKGTPGFTIGKTEHKMGIRGSSTTELIFDHVLIPKENLLGSLGRGFSIAMKTLDSGRIGIAAQALGIAQGALDQAVKYIKERQQFGKPISAFQGPQWYVAEMATKVNAARLLVYKAALLKQKNQPHSTEAAMAKLFAAETAMEVATRAVQLHGGYGYTREYAVERMMRDAKITEIYEGTSEVQKMIISSALLK